MSKSKYIFIGALVGFVFGIMPYIAVFLETTGYDFIDVDSWVGRHIIPLPLILIHFILKAEGMSGLIYFIIAPVIYPFIGALVGYFIYGRLNYKILKIAGWVMAFLIALGFFFYR